MTAFLMNWMQYKKKQTVRKWDFSSSLSRCIIQEKLKKVIVRGIGLPQLKKINDTFGEGADLRFREIVKKKLKEDFA